jgi:tight adherence protein C
MSQQVLLLGYFCLGSLGIALFLVAYGVASAPSSPSSPLGLRGLKRQRVLASNETWAAVEPLVRWLGVRVSGIMSSKQRQSLDEQIGLAGDWMGISAEEYLALSLLSSLVCIVAGSGAGYLVGGAGLARLLPLILGLVGLCLPYLQITGAAQERLKAISRGLPYAIDLMALAMGAGLDFPGAVRQVVQKSSNPDDPMIEEFTLLTQSLSLGRTRRDALTEFAKRAPVEAVKEFVGSLIQAEERGNPVAEVLQIQATGSRTRRSVRAEELAAKAGVAMVGPLMLVFAAVMMLILGPMYLRMKDGMM